MPDLALGLMIGEGDADSHIPPIANQYSVSFDGSDDYINVPHDTSLSLNSAGTFSVWVKMDTSHSIDYPYLFAKWAGSDSNYTFFTQATGGSAGKFIMRYWDGSSAQSSATEINRGVWVHLAATLDGSNLIYYVNGSADNTVSMGMGTTNTGDLRIGYSPSNIRPFPGLMDEAAIFNTKLSAAQISNIYKGEESGGSGGTNGVPGDLSTFNPVAWWRMGDGTEAGSGTTVYDMSDNSNNGTLTNGPTFSSSVPEYVFNQYSVSFDATNDYASVTQASAINISGDITLSAWVNRTATSSYNAIYTKRQVGGSMNYQLVINNGNGQIGLGHSGNSWVYNTTTTLSTSTWYHVAVTVSSGTAQFYVNGVAEDSFTGISITATTQDLIIGATVGYNYFGGNIDEASIFNSALSSSDISSIYNSGTPNDISSLNPVGWWRMGDNDGGTGTTITDQGSGGNNGTLTNGPTFSTSVPEYVFNQYSVSFDGTDDYMDVGTVSDLNGSISAVTLSAWFNFSGTYHTDKNLVLSGGSSGSDRFYFQQLSATQLRYGSSSGFVNFTIPTVSASTWYHMAIVHNGTSASAYFNGSPSSSNPQTVTAPTANYGTALKVGAYYTGSAVFGGLLDEVSVFDSALSAGDIEDIYNDGVPNDLGTDGLNLSPVGWWRMGDNDGGTGTTITDQGSGGNNGTLTNGPTFSTTVPS